VSRALAMIATAGLLASLPLAPAAAADAGTFVLTCGNGQTYTTLHRPGNPVFKDKQSRTVLVIQSAGGMDYTGVPDRLRTTCTFLSGGSTVVAEFLITPAG
jgi:hypothetical protein